MVDCGCCIDTFIYTIVPLKLTAQLDLMAHFKMEW